MPWGPIAAGLFAEAALKGRENNAKTRLTEPTDDNVHEIAVPDGQGGLKIVEAIEMKNLKPSNS